MRKKDASNMGGGIFTTGRLAGTKAWIVLLLLRRKAALARMRPGVFMSKLKVDKLALTAASLRHSPVLEGKPFPPGATWDGLGVNFALFSAHATKVELCLFDDAGRTEIERIDLPENTNEIWHGYLPDARPGTIYGYRVHGPFE